MKRQFLFLVIAFCCGITISRYLPIPTTLWLVIAAAALLVLAGFILYKRPVNLGLLLVGTAFLGALWFSVSRLPQDFNQEWWGEEVTGEGVVLTYPKTGTFNTTFTVKVNRLMLGNMLLNSVDKVLLKVNSAGNTQYLPGNVIAFQGNINKPREARNPGEQDYGQYLANLGIFHEITCQPQQLKEINPGSGLQAMAARGRLKVTKSIGSILPPVEAGLLLGILFGDVEGISAEDWDGYRRAGVLHLFAVSGFNIAFVLGVVWFILSFLKLGNLQRFVIAVPVLLGYYFTVGWTASIVRASVMALVSLFALLVGRKNDIYTALGLAAFLILLVNPGELFSVSFQLSFLTTLGIVYLTPFFEERGLNKFMAAALAAQLATTPLTAYYFNQLSLIAPLLNIAAVLVCGAVTVLAILGSFLTWILPVLAEPLFLTAGFLIFGLSRLVLWAAGWKWSCLTVATPSLLLVAAAYLFLALWPWRTRLSFLKRQLLPVHIGNKIRCLIGALTLLGLVWAVFVPAHEMQVVFLDVGQGDSIFIRTPNGHTVLVDGGGTPKSDFQAGGQIVSPFLRRQGLSRIDALIMSHNHVDHAEGLLELLEAYEVGMFIRPSPEKDNYIDDEVSRLCRLRNVELREAAAGQRITLDQQVFLEVLHPYSGDQASGNNHSLVLRLVYGNTQWLLPGDIENLALDELLRHNQRMQANILKIPHHGSQTSLNPRFYQAVSPEAVVVCVGRNNYNQPCLGIKDYFSNLHIPILVTREKGAVITESDGKRVKTRTVIR